MTVLPLHPNEPGPNQDIIDAIEALRMATFEVANEVAELRRREAVIPVVNVEAPLAPDVHVKVPTVDLTPVLTVLEALEGRAPALADPAIATALELLRADFAALGESMRHIAGASYGIGGGPGYVTTEPAEGKTWPTTDTYTGAEYLEDQTSAGALLTFSFTEAVDLVFVRSVGEDARVASVVDPTASAGAFCGDGENTPITHRTATIKAFAPTGAVVSVWGFRY